MKKLNLKKKVITVLTDQEKQLINGGGTTSYSDCSGFLCCTQKPCVPASEGAGITCSMNPEPNCKRRDLSMAEEKPAFFAEP